MPKNKSYTLPESVISSGLHKTPGITHRMLSQQPEETETKHRNLTSGSVLHNERCHANKTANFVLIYDVF